MIKLLTLDGDSSFSVDAKYRILSRMEFYGLYSENIFVHDEPDELLDAAVAAFEEGSDVIVAVEAARYIELKQTLMGRLMVETASSPEIAEAVSFQLLTEYNEEPIDLPAQCLVPADGKILLSNDGINSGFGYTGIKENRIFCVPLDYSRVDSVLDELIKKYYAPPEPEKTEPTGEAKEKTEPKADYDLTPSVQNLVYSLIQLDKRVAFSDSEAMEEIKGFADSVDGFGAVAYFVSGDSDGTYDVDKAQLMTVRRAKEALVKTGADFGCAVSDIVMSSVDGYEYYTAFVTVCDEKETTVKKITTDLAQNMDLILPKAITLLIDVLCQRADILSKDVVTTVPAGEATGGESGEEEKEEPVQMNISMIVVASIVALIAIICAVSFTVSFLKGETTTAPSESVPVINPIYSTEPPVVTDPTTASPIYSTEPSSSLLPQITTPDPNATTAAPLQPSETASVPDANSMVTEPTASQVTTTPTSVPASTGGTFTFYVFGYGHGVGLSQNGANAYAKQGWNYAEILANYYYGTTLVIGDSYPKTVTYAGAKYKLREYLASALVSEMNESFEPEALKAQVVALYTYAKYYNFEVSSTGNAFGKTPGDKAYQAVDAVLGYYLSYNGDTALTPFHSTSAGKTTSYYNVWGGTELPYLAGGRPSYDDYNATDFQTTYSITSEEFKSLAKSRCNIELLGDPSTWISVISHDACIDANTGYVYSVSVGGTMFTGYKFRSEVMAGTLRSHCFKVVYTPDPA